MMVNIHLLVKNAHGIQKKVLKRLVKIGLIIQL